MIVNKPDAKEGSPARIMVTTGNNNEAKVVKAKYLRLLREINPADSRLIA